MKTFSKLLSILLCLAMLVGIFAMTGTATPADHVVINEVYGGGGNSGAPYTHDFVELYNPTSADVNIGGWTIQYDNDSGEFSSSNVFTIPVGSVIRAGGYFLIQMAGGSNGDSLPSPDATGSLTMGAKKFKVALANDATVVTSATASNVVDFVGLQANYYEGQALGEASNTTSASRKEAGVDTNNNKADFELVAPNPRNSKYNPDAPTVNVTGVTVTETATVEAGNTVQLIATVSPDNATNNAVTWTSSNEAVATVSNGKVTGVKAGTATITVTTADGGKTDTCTVTVTARPTIEDGLYVIWNPGSGKALSSVTVNNYYRDGVDVTLDNNVLTGYGDTEIWVITNNDDGTITIATVAGNKLSMGTSFSSIPLDDVNDKWYLNTAADGQYYIKNAGRAGSTLQWYNSNFSTYTSPSVEFYGFIFTKHIAVTGVTLDKTTANLTIGEFAQLVATVAPENANNNAVSWSSSNEAVATVDNTGKVTAVAAGTATITVTTADGGKTATCTVTVSRPAAESVTMAPTSANIVVGETATLAAVVAPNLADQTVTWTSSNEAVATVDNTGKVTAVAAGTATITATTADGSKSATCTVTVSRPAAESVTMVPTSANIVVGETATLAAVVTPNLADQTVTWTSSNEAVATVDNTGKVTAVAAGTATITATTADGSKSATCAVTVVAQTVPATGVTLDKTTVSVKAGETATLTATVTPENTTDNATWTSSNTNVATVNGGVITAVAPGTATITVTAGSKTATCEVTVTAKVTNVTLDKSAAELKVNGEVQLNASVTANPNQDAYKNVTWTTSNATVATVENGKVKALKAGTVTITATSVTDTTKSASCTITITENTPATTPTTPTTPAATTPAATTPATTTPAATTPAATTPATTTTTVVNTPVVGTGFKFGMLQENLSKTLYITGNTANKDYYLETTENVADAVDVFLEETTGGYYIYFTKNGTKTYIDIYQNGSYVNIRLATEPSAVFSWNTEYKTLTTKVGEEEYYMGTYNTFNTLSASKLSYASTSFPVNFYSVTTSNETPAPTGDTFQPMVIALALLCVTAMAVLVINRKRII